MVVCCASEEWQSLGRRLASVMQEVEASDVEEVTDTLDRWRFLGSRLATALDIADEDDHGEFVSVRAGATRLASDGVWACENTMESADKWKVLGSRLANVLRAAADDEDFTEEVVGLHSAPGWDWPSSCYVSPAPSSIIPTDASTAMLSDGYGWSESEDDCSDIDGMAPSSRSSSPERQHSSWKTAWSGLRAGSVNLLNSRS